MANMIDDYKDKYGDIPVDENERFIHHLNNLNFKEKDMKKLNRHIKYIKSIKYDKLKFVLYIEPKSTPRARYSGRSRVFYVKGAREIKNIFLKFKKENYLNENNIITTGVKIHQDIYLPIPSGMNKIEKMLAELKLLRPLIIPDWDNVGKTYSDMIQPDLILDDSQIFEAHIRKFFSIKPRIEITLEFARNYDSNFNKKNMEKRTKYKDLLDNIEEKETF